MGEKIDGTHESDSSPSRHRIDDRSDGVIAPQNDAKLPPWQRLQQRQGNHAVQQLLRAGVVQTKLRISEPGDAAEREAERAAGAVTGVTESAREPLPIRTPADPLNQPTPERAVQSGGQPLSEAERAFFEDRFGRELGAVRIHHDSAANEAARTLSARAFTVGTDIVFGQGEFQPGSDQGRHLLAHELAHTIQQSESPFSIQREVSFELQDAQLPRGGKPADLAEDDASTKAIDAAIAASAVVVQGRYSTHHQEQLYIEPQGVIAHWDDAGVHVIGSIQCPYYVHKALVHAFGLPGERVHVTQSVTGGGFGGKEEYPSVISLHAALLAKKSGRHVRMIYDRKEDIEATTKRHPAICEITTGCDADGTLRALKMRILMDGGAYMTLSPVVLSRGALHAAGAYRWTDVRIDAWAVATNTPPNGAFRGFGAPQTIWAIERHLDQVAKKIGKDPVDLKRQNMIREGDTTATGQVLRGSVGIAECVEKAISASQYHEKRLAGPIVRGRTARGIGASIFMHGAGFTGTGETYLKGRVAVDLLAGGRLNIRTASTDIGQGTETVFRQIAADAAGLDLTAVDFTVPSTTHVPDSGPTVASRTVMVVGAIVERAAREVAARVRAEQDAGGGDFNAAADRLLAKEKTVTALVQYNHPEWVKFDDKTYKGDAYPVYGYACDVAEVEVDLDTLEVTVLGFWSATDVGKAIHPVMCKGQIEGGSLQAIGWALWENVVWKDGKILNPRMTNYIIPTALDAPPFYVDLVEAPYSYGPGGGAKGLGELPMDGGAPAIAAAIEHATGMAAHDLPLLPEQLLALQATRA